MIISNMLKDIIVFLIVFVPPLIVFIKFSTERNQSILKLIIISTIYIIGSLFTQNLMPFILVLFDISLIKQSFKYYEISQQVGQRDDEHSIISSCKNDYIRFNFSLRSFKIIKAVFYSSYSYAIILAVSLLTNLIINMFKLNSKDQDVVTWMAGLPLWKFMFVIPLTIVFAPILEEFVFRWILFEKLFAKKMNVIFASILSSLIFAFVHFNLKAFIIILCIGLTNCYLIHKKGFWYSVFNHSVFNFITTLVLLLNKLQIIKLGT